MVINLYEYIKLLWSSVNLYLCQSILYIQLYVFWPWNVILGGATKKDVSPRRKTAVLSRLTFDLMP